MQQINFILGGLALVCDEFSKNQLGHVAIQRETDWGARVINRDCFAQWRALATRFGMTATTLSNVATLRKWMETAGPVASVDRSARPGPSRVRRHEEMAGSSDVPRRSVRGRYDRSRSGDRSNSLNRGSSGQRQHRTRDDY